MTQPLRIMILLAVVALAAGRAHAQETMLRGTLEGANVVSATESRATGEVSAVLGEDGALQLDLVFAGLEIGATDAALHTGKINENGPLITRLPLDTGIGADATTGRIVGAQVTLTPADAAAARAGDSYVVITTIANPDGAIRAQLLPQPVRLGSPAVVPPATVPTIEVPATDVTPEPEPEEEDEE